MTDDRDDYYMEALEFLLLNKRRLLDAVRLAGFAEWREVPPKSSELGDASDRFYLYSGDVLLATYWVVVDEGSPTRLVFRLDRMDASIGNHWVRPHPDEWRRAPDDDAEGGESVN